MMTHHPLIDLAVLLAFGVALGLMCYFADKRNARKNSAV
jgi:hypothetical protein